MYWVYFALAASFLWAVANIIGKYTLFSLNKETTLVILLIGSASSLALLPFFHLSFSPFAVLAGLFWVVAYYFYVQGLAESEVSNAIALLLTIPIFVAIISRLALNEVLNTLQYGGIIIAVLGAFMLSVGASIRGISFKRGALLMIGSGLFFSVSDVTIKYALSFGDPVSVEFWVQVTGAAAGVALFFLWRHKLDFRSYKLIAFSTINGVLSTLGSFLYAFAYSMTLASLAAPVETVQPLFVFIMATALARLKPHWLKEDVSMKALLVKIAGILLLVAGVFLVAG